MLIATLQVETYLPLYRWALTDSVTCQHLPELESTLGLESEACTLSTRKHDTQVPGMSTKVHFGRDKLETHGCLGTSRNRIYIWREPCSSPQARTTAWGPLSFTEVNCLALKWLWVDVDCSFMSMLPRQSPGTHSDISIDPLKLWVSYIFLLTVFSLKIFETSFP